MGRYYFFQSHRLGIILAIISFILAFIEDKEGYVFPHQEMLIIAFLLLGIGRIVIIDKHKKKISESWRYFYFLRLYPIFKEDFDKIKSITLQYTKKEIKHRSENPRLVIILNLINGSELQIFRWPYYKRVRKISERIAKILNVKIFDRSDGPIRVRKPDELDKTICEQVLEKKEPPINPNRPVSDNLLLIESDHKTIVKLLPKRWSYSAAALSNMIAIIIFIIGYANYSENIEVGIIFMSLGVILSSYSIIRIFLKRYKIIITINNDKISYRYVLMWKSVRLNKLEELYIAQRSIFLVGDKREMILPYEAFNKEEKEIQKYLLQLIQYKIYEYNA